MLLFATYLLVAAAVYASAEKTCDKNYEAVDGKGCSGYISMNDTVQYTLQDCADAVQRLNWTGGCKGRHFF